MKQLYNILLVTVGVALASTALCAPTLGQESVRDERAIINEFKSEAPKAWGEDVETYRNQRIKSRMNVVARFTPYGLKKNRRQHATFNYEYTVWSERGDTVAEGNSDSQPSYVDGTNDLYRFYLLRVGENKWEIDSVIPWKNGNPISKRIDPETADDIMIGELDVLKHYLSNFHGLRIGAGYFPIIVKQPEFRIKSAEEYGEGDARRVRIRFTREATDAAPWPIASGEVTLMPSRFWLIESGEYVLLDDNGNLRLWNETQRWKNEYAELKTDDGATLPYVALQTSENVEEGVVEKSLRTTEKKCEKEIIMEEFEPDRFRISHYGLTEPDFEKKTSDNE